MPRYFPEVCAVAGSVRSRQTNWSMLQFFVSISAVYALTFTASNRRILMGWDSSVGITTRYGLDGTEIESRRGKVFPTRPDQLWGPPNLLYSGYRVFPWRKTAGAWR